LLRVELPAFQTALSRPRRRCVGQSVQRNILDQPGHLHQ
jgi:hypothetical protein